MSSVHRIGNLKDKDIYLWFDPVLKAYNLIKLRTKQIEKQMKPAPLLYNCCKRRLK